MMNCILIINFVTVSVKCYVPNEKDGSYLREEVRRGRLEMRG
jgi:hypothetical protein